MVLQSEFQNITKSNREFDESSVALKHYGNHNSKTPQNPTGNWLKAPLCGKLSGNHNSKTPQHPSGNWLEAPLCGKRCGNHNSKTPQPPLTPPRELVEISAVNGNGVEIIIPKHHEIP